VSVLPNIPTMKKTNPKEELQMEISELEVKIPVFN
jgi:hypothetical protein